jgi:arylformamidase
MKTLPRLTFLLCLTFAACATMNTNSYGPFLLDYKGYKTPAEFGEGYYNFITPAVVEHWDARFTKDGAKVLAELPVKRDLAYGPKPTNTMDFFPALEHPETAPTLVYIHGGLWFLSDKKDTHCLAPGYVRHGVNFLTINYSLAPKVDLATIVKECQTAVAWAYTHAGELGIDTHKFIVSGHSAGGQLCTMMNSTDWPKFQSGLPADVLKGCVGISGFYDIEPTPGTFVDEGAKVPHDQYVTYNSLRHIRPKLPPVLLIIGAKESSLLQQQTQGYAVKFREAGNAAETKVVVGEDHFSVLYEMNRSASSLHHDLIAWIKKHT